MSTVKVNEVRHLSNSGTANLILESNATTNLQATSTLGLTVTGTLTVSGVSTFNGNMVVGNAITDTVDLQSKVTGFNNFSGFTGEVRMYAGNEGPNAPPSGWLYCNGDTISETSGDGGTHYNADGKLNDYQLLFNLLKANSNWGNSGSPAWGTDTVKLPDFRSRSPVGVHTGAANALPTGLTARTIGIGTSVADGSTLVGTETHTLTTAQLPSHTHTATNNPVVSGQALNSGTLTIAGNMPQHVHTQAHTHNMPHTHTMAHTHGISLYRNALHYTEANTGRTSETNAPEAVTGDTTGASSAANTGASSAAATGAVNTANTGNATSTPAMTISGTVNTALNSTTHTHTITVAATGTAGDAHNNLSPIIAVNYIIKV